MYSYKIFKIILYNLAPSFRMCLNVTSVFLYSYSTIYRRQLFLCDGQDVILIKWTPGFFFFPTVPLYKPK